MEILGCLIDKEYFSDIKNYVSLNYQIAEFYENMWIDTGEEKFLNLSHNVDLCGKWLDFDYYKFQGVKDLKRINLCHNKFCFNCQSMLSAKRMLKYSPVLDGYKKEFSVCHMVLTVPNCKEEEVHKTVLKMYDTFRIFIRYFNGNRKIKGLNFSRYGYAGAVRGLEITQNQEDKTFHPHFHCMVLFRKGVDLEWKHTNSFSYDKRGNKVRMFSDLEILIQKLWYLLYNGRRVTLKLIDELQEGYSCIVEDCLGDYHEVFKYACKGAFDPDEGGFIYKEHVFRTLYKSLFNRRMIQGYGLLYNFDDLEGELLEDEVSSEYERIIAELRSIETPEFTSEKLDEVIEHMKYIKYISKNNLKRLILERRRADEAEKNG